VNFSLLISSFSKPQQATAIAIPFIVIVPLSFAFMAMGAETTSETAVRKYFFFWLCS